jgi:hypothetical protein
MRGRRDREGGCARVIRMGECESWLYKLSERQRNSEKTNVKLGG